MCHDTVTTKTSFVLHVILLKSSLKIEMFAHWQVSLKKRRFGKLYRYIDIYTIES